MYKAGLEAHYEPLTQKIPLGTRPGFGWLNAALVAASLSEPGHPVTEADVRCGAARPFLFRSRGMTAVAAREAVVRDTASRRSAIRPCSRVSR